VGLSAKFLSPVVAASAPSWVTVPPVVLLRACGHGKQSGFKVVPAHAWAWVCELLGPSTGVMYGHTWPPEQDWYETRDLLVSVKASSVSWIGRPSASNFKGQHDATIVAGQDESKHTGSTSIKSYWSLDVFATNPTQGRVN
jgi:hypothetical protein